ncbi:MAG: hypothetical protein SVK08_04320 [Halobacteriota archaeon]|nr:hypothetical protein [Halobacteriota archaeon]
MGEDDRCCTYYCKDTMLHKGDQCEGKILRKEPILSPEKMIGQISGAKTTLGGEIKEGTLYYLYQCENGHILYRPGDWADVEEVSPGTIKSSNDIVNKPPTYEGA